MKTSGSTKNLMAALVKFMEKVDPILKGADNTFHKSKYANLETVLSSVVPALQHAGLVILQPTSFVDGIAILVTRLCHVASDEWIEGEWPLLPVKSGPQELKGALTYGRRGAVMAILNLAEEDDDGAVASGTVKHPPQQKQPIVVLDNPGEYVLTFGFHKGKRLKDIDAYSLEKSVNYVKGLTDPYPAALEFLTNAKAYMGEKK